MKELGDVSCRDFEKFLLSEGYLFKGITGSHAKYKKIGIVRPVIVPRHKKLPDFVIITNLRTMGITKEYFISKMKEL